MRLISARAAISATSSGRPARRFSSDEIVERGDANRDTSDGHHHRALPQIVERYGRLQKQIDHRHAAGGPQREDQHGLLPDPFRPFT
jgi:hypothetical protein